MQFRRCWLTGWKSRFLQAITPTLLDALTGIVIGAIIFTVVTVGGRLWNAGKKRG